MPSHNPSLRRQVRSRHRRCTGIATGRVRPSAQPPTIAGRPAVSLRPQCRCWVGPGPFTGPGPKRSGTSRPETAGGGARRRRRSGGAGPGSAAARSRSGELGPGGLRTRCAHRGVANRCDGARGKNLPRGHGPEPLGRRWRGARRRRRDPATTGFLEKVEGRARLSAARRARTAFGCATGSGRGSTMTPRPAPPLAL
jgi:hypothetical protein